MKKKIIKQLNHGRLYVYSSFNNTLVTVTDDQGNTVSSSSAGCLGFKGARKATPYAAQLASKAAVEKAKEFGLDSLDVSVSGVGPGRESAVRVLSNLNIKLTSIKDVTPLPHNGCRAKKIRRV